MRRKKGFVWEGWCGARIWLQERLKVRTVGRLIICSRSQSDKFTRRLSGLGALTEQRRRLRNCQSLINEAGVDVWSSLRQSAWVGVIWTGSGEKERAIMQTKANQSFSELSLMGVDTVVAEWTHLVNKAVILSWKYDLSSSSFSKKSISR